MLLVDQDLFAGLFPWWVRGTDKQNSVNPRKCGTGNDGTFRLHCRLFPHMPCTQCDAA
jgi:hypothetical protein